MYKKLSIDGSVKKVKSKRRVVLKHPGSSGATILSNLVTTYFMTNMYWLCICISIRFCNVYHPWIWVLMPCPFTGSKMFCAGPNFLRHPKNLNAFSASSKTFVPAQKPILLNANHLFVSGTNCLWLPQYVNNFWSGTKNFGTCKRTRQ